MGGGSSSLAGRCCGADEAEGNYTCLMKRGPRPLQRSGMVGGGERAEGSAARGLGLRGIVRLGRGGAVINLHSGYEPVGSLLQTSTEMGVSFPSYISSATRSLFSQQHELFIFTATRAGCNVSFVEEGSQALSF